MNAEPTLTAPVAEPDRGAVESTRTETALTRPEAGLTRTEAALTRRAVLTAGAVVAGAAGVAALAGCSKGSSGSNDHSAPGAGGSGGSAGSGGSGGAAPGTVLAKVSDVPVGNALSAKMGGDPILISQPAAGTIVTFSAICTHQGCTVAPAGKEFHCPCHGSVYDAATGAVLHGPAPAPLTKIPTHVANGDVVTGA